MVRIQKHIPNALSALRILCSLLLLMVQPLSAMFFGIYIVCGISDVLDGYTARRTNSASPLGANVDSIADAVFTAALLAVFLPLLSLPLWIICWIAAVTLVRLGSLLVGYIKYRALSFLHTYANKATGLMLFSFPFLYSLFGLTATLIVICGLASCSAVEELIINLKSKELLRDQGSMFMK
ncbi:CDP-alcohol phosphatidyltransferase family protein [Paenibacillus donghaensis]|uniref:CDP-alcohol phosphatidyltransferase n=1 Tax=Paenibacillus donghaensis TaxID=414771 RepID=A0A2Z2KYR7_9BACL|nr:CDP-alcohol phosphatidyltransferase family protein [Paenibacillus donghaensis]ASA25768.1 CDP-alcohol phosphatidyltransferase [Paenibacillus donghaensis]